MSAPNRKSSAWVKGLIAVVIVVGIGIVVLNELRATAIVTPVTRGRAADIVTGSVVVHAERDLQEIRSDLPGRVSWIDPRQLGTPFKAGEPILKLDSADLEREMKQAKEEFDLLMERKRIERERDPRLQVAKEALENVQRRFKRGEVSEDDVKAAQRVVDKVQTELELADLDVKQTRLRFQNEQTTRQRALDKMTIRAPMDGIMQGVLVANGALISAGTTIGTFFSNERVVIAKVGEEDVGKVKVGQAARVRLLNLGGETFDAKVTTILPFADADTQRYSVYLDVNAPVEKLKPFSTGEATITVGERDNQPLVPRRAIFNDDYVFVVHDGTIEKRKVTLGFRALNFAEVTGNLKEGELVVVDDVDQFRDGQRVRVTVAR